MRTTPLEKSIERRLADYCKKADILCLKFVSPGNKGVPDRILIRQGRVLFLELKQKGKRPTPLQFHTLEKFREHGAVAEWADSFESAVHIMERVFA